eukprot:UN08197
MRLRIVSKGGKISNDKEGNAVMVGLTPHKQHAFSLGVANTLGDEHAVFFGATHTPEITKHTLKPRRSIHSDRL